MELVGWNSFWVELLHRLLEVRWGWFETHCRVSSADNGAIKEMWLFENVRFRVLYFALRHELLVATIMSRNQS